MYVVAVNKFQLPNGSSILVPTILKESGYHINMLLKSLIEGASTTLFFKSLQKLTSDLEEHPPCPLLDSLFEHSLGVT